MYIIIYNLKYISWWSDVMLLSFIMAMPSQVTVKTPLSWEGGGGD